MGGVAGHLAHLYDNRDLTFDKLRKQEISPVAMMSSKSI